MTGYQLIWYQQAWCAASHNVATLARQTTAWSKVGMGGRACVCIYWGWVYQWSHLSLFLTEVLKTKIAKKDFGALGLLCVVFHCCILQHLAPLCVDLFSLRGMDTVMYFGTVWSWDAKIAHCTQHVFSRHFNESAESAKQDVAIFFYFVSPACMVIDRPFPVKIHTEYWVEFDTLRYQSLIPILTLELNIPQQAGCIFDDMGSAAYPGICSTVSSTNCMGFRPLWACKSPLRSWGFLQLAKELDDFQSEK